MGDEKAEYGLLLWSLLSSPCIFDAEKTKSLFLLWEDIWQKGELAPWQAKVPISSVGGPGEYAEIHGIGSTSGWFATYNGYTPGFPKLPLYQVVDDAGISMNPPAKLGYLTKRRLEAWLKKAYPQRYRHPEPLLGVNLSWAELFGSSANLHDLTSMKEAFIEMEAKNAQALYGKLSAFELEQVRASAGERFTDALKTYRKRRRRSQRQVLENGPWLRIIVHPKPEFYLCKGRLMAFNRCIVYFRSKDGQERVLAPRLPFAVDGAVDLP